MRFRKSELLLDRLGDAVKTMMRRQDAREESVLFGALSAQQAMALKAYCAANKARVGSAFGGFEAPPFGQVQGELPDDAAFVPADGRIQEDSRDMTRIYARLEHIVQGGGGEDIVS
ncbi:hypothetical protein TeGR_g7334 [Tetraparma gracilis]|uniref:Uncharacterized protein n=1 Tax=Tetraparma gracilis TaxID=2962635 RepID=A0ABQ6M608_9STRA|nr:hypothetical protein TeGR_g7334 [Tetraparma gracilis]